MDVAQGLEGIVRNASIHAAAVVIADRPLTDIVPLQLADAGTGENGQKIYRTVTQYSMKPIEEIGLLKMDFLGLRNLDVIEDALDIIERSTGERPDMATLPLDDEKTYEMMARGDSVGVFQFESEGMREALQARSPRRSSRTSSRSSRSTARAPWTRSPTYARGKRNPDSINYIDDRLRPITDSTKGVILYQEQAMQIAKRWRVQRPEGGRPAQGDRQEEPRGDGQAQARVLRGLQGVGHGVGRDRDAVGDQREVGRLLLQQVRIWRHARDPARREADPALEAYRLQPAELMSMWADGEIRPNRSSGSFAPAASHWSGSA